MNIKSYTFQSISGWNSKIEKEFQVQSLEFLEKIKMSHTIMGCLQSFTFPADYDEAKSVKVAESVSDVYRKSGCFLLGGDTSSGDSLVITLVALIK